MSRRAPYRHSPRYFARILRRNDGLVALEFALIAPVLLLIVLGTIEFALIMFTTAAMESATLTTSRLGKTGYTTGGLSRQQLIINTIQSRTAGLLNPTLLSISTTVYSGFQNVSQPEPY